MNAYAITSSALFGADAPVNLPLFNRPLFNRNTSLVVDRVPSEPILNSAGVPTLTIERLLPRSASKPKPKRQTGAATKGAGDDVSSSNSSTACVSHTAPAVAGPPQMIPAGTIASFNITRGINSTVAVAADGITQTPTPPRPRPSEQSSVSLPAGPKVVCGSDDEGEGEGNDAPLARPPDQLLGEPYPPSPGPPPEKPLPPLPRNKTRGGLSAAAARA